MHGKYEPNQLLSGMENGDVVMLALRPFLGEISGEGRVPLVDVFGCIVKGMAQISRTAFFHVWVTISEQA